MTPPDAPLKPPKQVRSKRTLERIVRASLEILEEGGPEALTVQALVRRSGSSVGSLYARFDGKEDLLHYLGERVWREAAARWDRVLEGEGLDQLALPQLVDGAVRLLADTAPARMTALSALDRSSGSGRQARRRFREHLLLGIERLLLGRSREIRHPNPPVAVRLGLQAALALLEGPSEGPGGTETAIPPDERVEETTRLLLSYLVGETTPGDDAGDVDFFDIWG
jgi:AcrR family transcriptional regulator